MHGWETRMLLKYYLEQGVSKSELSRRFRDEPSRGARHRAAREAARAQRILPRMAGPDRDPKHGRPDRRADPAAGVGVVEAERFLEGDERFVRRLRCGSRGGAGVQGMSAALASPSAYQVPCPGTVLACGGGRDAPNDVRPGLYDQPGSGRNSFVRPAASFHTTLLPGHSMNSPVRRSMSTRSTTSPTSSEAVTWRVLRARGGSSRWRAPPRQRRTGPLSSA